MTSSSSTLNVSTFDSALAAGADRADDDATDDAPEETFKISHELEQPLSWSQNDSNEERYEVAQNTLLHEISFSPIAT